MAFQFDQHRIAGPIAPAPAPIRNRQRQARQQHVVHLTMEQRRHTPQQGCRSRPIQCHRQMTRVRHHIPLRIKRPRSQTGVRSRQHRFPQRQLRTPLLRKSRKMLRPAPERCPDRRQRRLSPGPHRRPCLRQIRHQDPPRHAVHNQMMHRQQQTSRLRCCRVKPYRLHHHAGRRRQSSHRRSRLRRHHLTLGLRVRYRDPAQKPRGRHRAAPANRQPPVVSFTLQPRPQQVVMIQQRLQRARLEREGDDWWLSVGRRGAVSASGLLRRVSVSDAETEREVMAAEAAAAVGRLSPSAGVMVQAVWFDAAAAKPGRLLLAVHHLVVDGVSWRILMPDLAEAWSAVRSGREPSLAAVGTSFRRWSEHLAGLAQERGSELALWEAMLAGSDPCLGSRPLDAKRDVVANARHLTKTLDRARTAALLGRVPALFHGQVNDVLLTGLALAVADWRRRWGYGTGDAVLIELEGHGREESAGIDLSRTVGWFTSLYPVRLDAGGLERAQAWSGGASLGDAVKQIKEQLRGVPENGLGYGLLRYLNTETGAALTGLPRPQIGFNYLGRFAAGGSGDWSLATELEAFGGGGDAQMPLRHALEVNAITLDEAQGPQLAVRWSWAGGVLTETQVADLAQSWLEALAALVEHAERPDAGGLTPSDIPLVSLSQAT